MLFPCTVCSRIVSLWALLLSVIISHDRANNLCSLYLNIYLVSLGFWWLRAYEFLDIFPLRYIMFIRFGTFTYPCAICQRRCARITISTCIVFLLNMNHTNICSIEISALVHIVIDIDFFFHYGYYPRSRIICALPIASWGWQSCGCLIWFA